MKKIILSAAVAAMAFSTSAMAADKGIDIDVGGQAVVWYQTVDVDGADTSFFDQDNSIANVGVQLDLGADLGNNFTFGSQVSYVGTAGLEKNLVSGVSQMGGTTVQGSTTDDLVLSKIFIAKKIANTTVKIGRQELPMSLSPLAYSEGWNVFKNTFDAIVAINTDIPNTTLVGAYVSGGTGHTRSIGSTGDLPAGVTKGAYMITAQTTAIPMTTLTASYYHLSGIGATNGSAAVPAVTTIDTNGDTVTLSPAVAAVAKVNGVSADAIWIDAQVKPMDMLTVGLQYGNLDLDASGADDTTAYGVKVGANAGAISGYVAYSDVDDGSLAARNYGTGDKTPLYTQLVLTEDSASLDAKAITAGISYNMGDMGSVTARYGQVKVGDAGNIAEGDETEFDLIYSVKAGGVNYFAAYVNQERDFDGAVADTEIDVIRVWARYNF